MRSIPRGLLGLILPLLLAPAAEAQTVTGTFTDGETGEPIAGGVVVLLDEAGERVAGAITTLQGHYRVRAPVAGRYRLEGRMLGYRTVSPRPFVLAEGARMRWDLQTITDPIEMDGVTAEVASRCRARPDATGEAQRLWDLAKTTLTAVALTDNAERIRFVAQTFEREINARARMVVREEVDSARAVRTHPFRSVPVDALLSKGFVDQAGDTVVYYAPDAGTVLSEAFLATHCFRAVEGESGRVGLAFEPLPERRGLSEIEGALWLDPETGGIEMLEFDYVHMPRAPWPYNFGGQVEYERLGNGAWIVGRWLLRLPQPMSSEAWVPTRLGRRVRFGVAGSAGVREVGGEVLEVAGIGTHSLFDAPAGSVEGRLVSESGRPIPDALVYLSGTQHADSTDADGRFRLAGVREGDHSLVWFHAGLARTITPDLVDVRVVSNETTTATLTIAGFGRWPADGCAAAERREGTGVVFGMVREAEEGAPLRGAVLRLVPAVAASAASRADLAPVATASGSSGEFRFCAVRPGEYRLEAERADLAADSTPVIVAAGGLSRHAVELGREEF